jgi:aspartate/tyrosine/aromatic aminotransferase
VLELLEASPPEPILKLIAEHQNDPRAEKIDLGVGVYRNEQGTTPILSAVKKSERWLLDRQASKAYLGSRGDAGFCEALENLVFGGTAVKSDVYTLQTPGGSGALRVAAGVILRAAPDATIWVSDPTWDNHVPLLGGAGFAVRRYPYYDFERHTLCIERMLAALDDAQSGDLVLLHACCHNPTGMDLSREQWEQLAEFLAVRHLLPFVDFAYHGFAAGIQEDSRPVRLLRERFPEMFVAYSCSKNFGLYRDRVGAISFVSERADLSAVDAQVQNVVRTMYSMPPDHGGAVVEHILANESLRAEWLDELTRMRCRMQDMRRLLVSALRECAPGFDSSHIERANGMFCYLGLSSAQVERLKRDFGVYMVESSRINVCGITPINVHYLAESIAAVL